MEPDKNAPSARAAQPVLSQSPNDRRSYRLLTLDNSLKVLLAHDASTDKAAAALTVFRGSYHEPPAYAGLAHFLEHMLFIGTAKYPEPDAYQKFVSAHGGSTNAYTALDHTNYFFDIAPDHFREGLDRFAQFFIDPLFSPEYVDREKNAVNSEYALQTKDDGWRGYVVAKQALNPAHPGSRFTIGSLETLGEGVRGELLNFFEQHYSADQMALVVLSNESLDQLESWVVPLFEGIEDRDIGPAPVTEPLFRKDDLPAVLEYKPVNTVREITFNFPVPATSPHYRAKPEHYIANLLGHEGNGSLHERLKAHGWIESLGAGSDQMDDRTSLLTVSIELTEAGYRNLPRVADHVFAYLDLLRDTGAQQWRYQEQAQIAELNFRFQEPSSATAFVYSTAPAFLRYPAHEVLAGPYRMAQFDEALINGYLDALTRDNAFIEIAAPEVTTNAVDPWFGVEYALARKHVATAGATVDPLTLPGRNAFVPDNLALLTDDPSLPTPAIERNGLALWLDTDTSFDTPRTNLFLLLALPQGLTTPDEIARANLFAELITDHLNEYAYDALIAGLSYRLARNPSGLTVSVSGYSDRQLTLLKEILDAIVEAPLDPARFDVLKQAQLKAYRNFANERPYLQTVVALNQMATSAQWPAATLADELEDLTLAELADWRTSRIARVNVEALVHGNETASSARDLADLLATTFTLDTFPIERNRAVDFTAAAQIELSIDHDDAALALFVQDEAADYDTRARSALAAQLMSQAYFSDLRTEQQLGYVVQLAHRTYRDHAGVLFIVQSPVADPARLRAATTTFVETFVAGFDAMSDAEFNQHKAGLITRLTEADRNLAYRGDRLWRNLQLGITTFDNRDRLAEAVANVTKPDARAFLESLEKRLADEAIAVYSRGKFESAPSVGTPFTTVEAFKRR